MLVRHARRDPGTPFDNSSHAARPASLNCTLVISICTTQTGRSPRARARGTSPSSGQSIARNMAAFSPGPFGEPTHRDGGVLDLAWASAEAQRLWAINTRLAPELANS